MDHIFLSDVHLGAFAAEKNQLLETEIIQLVSYCSKHQIKLHLLGDLFDYWMELPGYVPPLGKVMLDTFQQYNQQMGSATFITGNHDFWTQGHFEERGFNVNTEYVNTEIDDKRILLFHGDGLSDTSFNLKRPLLNSVLRNQAFVSLYKKIFPGKTANHIMKKFSGFTRDEEDLHPQRLTSWAKEFFGNSQYHYIITGHDHVARIETFANGTYINCGAFYRDRTMARYTNGGFELVVWDGTAQIMQPY